MVLLLKVASILAALNDLSSSYGTLPPDYNVINRANEIGAAITNTLTTLLSNDTMPTSNEIIIRCANPYNPSFVRVQMNDPNLNTKIDLRRPIAFFVHGWFDHGHRTWMKQIAADYTRYLSGNICIVDWGAFAFSEYFVAASHTTKVSAYLATFIRMLQKRYAVHTEGITLIGHSMGAQVCGQTGRMLKGRIGFIVGLDPAGWAFTKPQDFGLMNRLDPSDAFFVQCIHTDITLLGTQLTCGHQDWFANDVSKVQPGCNVRSQPDDAQYVCSHFKAVDFFRFSLNPYNKFRGVLCSNYFDWVSGRCHYNPTDNFGLFSSRHLRGIFYLQTRSQPPFTI